MSAEMLTALDQLYANANRLVAAIGESGWSRPTPCTAWDVTALVNHMTFSTRTLEASATRAPSTVAPGDDLLGDDPVGSFAAAAAAITAAWNADGALDGMVSTPVEMPAVGALGINLLDIGIHCWDLAEATGQHHGLTAGQVALIDQLVRQTITPEIRDMVGFDPPLPGADGDGLAAMLAFTGRRG